MFSSLDQPRIIFVSLFIGVIIGVFYEFFYLLKLFFQGKVFKEILDAVWISSSAFIYIQISAEYSFPNFRLYTLAFIVIGTIIYLFSFHKIIAIFLNRVYNIIVKLFKRVKRFYDRPKEKKSILRSFVRSNNANSHSSGSTSVSISRHIRKEKANRTIR